MDDSLVNQLAQFAWEAFRAIKPTGVRSAVDLTTAAESTVRLFGEDPIDPSLDGLGEKEITALRICIELDSANAIQMNEAVVTLAQAFEPFIKRLLARVDEEAFAKYRRSKRSFDLAKALAHLGLGLPGRVAPEEIDTHNSPQREIDWAYVARNECAHGAPLWPRADRDRRREAIVAAMILSTHEHRTSLTNAHAAVDWNDLTRRILDQTVISEMRSRFVTLIAGEQALTPIEPTASETAWMAHSDVGTAPRDENANEVPDDEDDSDDVFERDSTLFEQRRGKVAQLILDIGRFLLVGRPGAGKTTSLRMVEWQLAKDLADGTQPLAPVLVDLKRCRPSAGAGVLTLAAKQMGILDAEQILADGEVVLLLDGVNEVAESEFDAVQIEIDDILSAYPTLPVVITSRPDWHRNQARLPVFALDPLDDARIEEFLNKNMRPDIALRFLADLRSFPKLWAIARNPLTLAMLARVGEDTGGLVPDNRAIVIKRFFKSIAQREASKASQLDSSVKRILLSRLAWEMRTHGVMMLSTEHALGAVAAARSDFALGVNSEAFLDEATDNGFLEHFDGEVTFEHEVFLDYFAAVELARQVDKSPTIATELSKQPRWRETVLLAYGLSEPKSSVRTQVTAGRASVAAEALLEQKDTTIEQRVELARSISTRDDSSSPETDVLLSLITLGDGDSLFRWFLENRNRTSALARLDPSSVDVTTAIRVLLSLMQAEYRDYPNQGAQMLDSHGCAFGNSQRPSHSFRSFVRNLPGTVPTDLRHTLEEHVLETAAAHLPRGVRWNILVELSAFLPSFLVRDDLIGEKGHSLARLCHRELLEGRLPRALPAYVELSTTLPPTSEIERFGPPLTAGRDWNHLLTNGIVSERETSNLLDWIGRLLETPVPDPALRKAFNLTPRPKIILFSDGRAHVFARCLSVLTALAPSDSRLEQFGLPQLLRDTARKSRRAPKRLTNVIAMQLAKLSSAPASRQDQTHASALALHCFLKDNIGEIIYTACTSASTHLNASATHVSLPHVRIPTTEEEARVFDRIHTDRRFSFTVIALNAETRYRFLKFDESSGMSAFYWPPDDASHPVLHGGERVTAEIRSTWIKKKECWGINAINLQVQSAPRLITTRSSRGPSDSTSPQEPGGARARLSNQVSGEPLGQSEVTKTRRPIGNAKQPGVSRSTKRRSYAKTISGGMRITSGVLLFIFVILLGLAAFVAMTGGRELGPPPI